MRVGVDLTSWPNRRGYGRFTRGLIRALLEVDRDSDYVLFVDSQTFADGGLPQGARIIVAPTRIAPSRAASATARRSLRDLWVMRRAVARVALDVFFFPTVYMYFPIRSSAKVIVGIHDVIAEEFPNEVFPDKFRRRLWAMKGWLARRRADYFMTVSSHARRGLVRVFGIPEERIWVVGEAADAVFQPLAREEIDRELLARFGLSLDDRVILYLGGFNPHKNLGMLVRSLAELRGRNGGESIKLVLIGDTADNFTPGLERLRRAIAEAGLDEVVVFTGFLEDEETRQLLAFGRALALPSLAEGFGLPAVEAAACGTPVVATRNSPLPEILDGGGLFVDPREGEDLTRALARILSDDRLQARLGERARERALQLSWKRSAEQFQELLAAVAGGAR